MHQPRAGRKNVALVLKELLVQHQKPDCRKLLHKITNEQVDKLQGAILVSIFLVVGVVASSQWRVRLS